MDDVVVLELRGELRLVDEHGDEVGVVGEVRQDLLDRDRLLEALDAPHARLPDLGHAADGDPLEQRVLAELARTAGGAGRRVSMRWVRKASPARLAPDFALVLAGS